VFLALTLTKHLRIQIMNVPLINQLALDFYCCAILTAIYSIKICNLYLTGTCDYVLCILLSSEAFSGAE